MKLDKERFFEVVDCGQHLNTQTKEAYWNFYISRCAADIITLYKEGKQLFPDSGIHNYIITSINRELQLNIQEESDKINPIVTPSQKERATTWGYNDDVKGK